MSARPWRTTEGFFTPLAEALSCDGGRPRGGILCECKRIELEQAVGGRDEREVVAIDRKLLAEADYGPVDFK